MTWWTSSLILRELFGQLISWTSSIFKTLTKWFISILALKYMLDFNNSIWLILTFRIALQLLNLHRRKLKTTWTNFWSDTVLNWRTILLMKAMHQIMSNPEMVVNNSTIKINKNSHRSIFNPYRTNFHKTLTNLLISNKLKHILINKNLFLLDSVKIKISLINCHQDSDRIQSIQTTSFRCSIPILMRNRITMISHWMNNTITLEISTLTKWILIKKMFTTLKQKLTLISWKRESRWTSKKSKKEFQRWNNSLSSRLKICYQIKKKPIIPIKQM